jgi:hypothetical protein
MQQDFLNCALNGMSLQPTDITGNNYIGYFPPSPLPKTTWDFWQNTYYPNVIRETYPIYLQERSIDNGKKAFEILKSLMDKKIVKLEKVSDFIEAMDTLIKIL